MKSKTIILLIVFSFFSCNSQTKIISDSFELTIAKNSENVLILFPCFPCNSEHTRKESPFLKTIEENNITTLLLNENQKLFLTENEKQDLEQVLQKVFIENSLENQNIYIGGFSSGGNLALLLSEYLLKKSSLKLKGVFVVDSPIDLEQLYFNSEKEIQKNFNETSIQESQFIIDYLTHHIGHPREDKQGYIKFSTFLNSENSHSFLDNLNSIKIRFYSEPNLNWYEENRTREFEELNAFQLKNAFEYLSKQNPKAELIFTENKGVRANGEIHPHSWNIVDGNDLLNWILN